MKNKGISLIVLVITIIVIIILASAIILMVIFNNPIDSAKKANIYQECNSFKDQFNMYVSTKASSDMDFEVKSLNNKSGENLYEYVPLIEDKKIDGISYKDILIAYDGKVLLKSDRDLEKLNVELKKEVKQIIIEVLGQMEKKVELRITFDPNEGSGGPVVQDTVCEVESATLTKLKPTREGYEFIGWKHLDKIYNDADGDIKITDLVNDQCDDFTLTAEWKQTVYTVAYDKGNASSGTGLPESVKINHNEDVTVSKNVLAKASEPKGYKITYTTSDDTTSGSLPSVQTQMISYSPNGWTDNQSIYPNDSKIRVTHDMTLFPNWNLTYENVSIAQNTMQKQTKKLGAVTFNYNGNGNETTTSNAKEEYISNGWYSADGTKYSSGQEIKLTSNLVLYPNFESKKVSVALPEPTRENYAFKGWYTDPTGGELVTNYTSTDDITLYAHWVGGNYAVIYDGNGNTSGNVENSTHVFGTEKQLNANSYVKEYTITYNYNDGITPNSQSKVTSKFKNWNTNQDGSGVTYTDKQSVLNLTNANTNITLYAQWENGIAQKNNPLRQGYTFAGWYTSLDDANPTVSLDSDYIPNGNVTLYAKWNINEYTITYSMGEATSGTLPENQKANYNENVILAKNELVKNDENVSKVTFDYNGNGNTSDIRYVKNVYEKIGWKSLDNTYSNNQVINLTSDLNLEPLYNKVLVSVTFPSAPTWEKHIFKGWYTEANGGTEVKGYAETEDITLYAHWEDALYNITLNNSGASSSGTSKIYLAYGTGIYRDEAMTSLMTTSSNSITIPSKTNYTFGGYYTNANGQGTRMISSTGYITSNFTNTLFNGDNTLYAYWYHTHISSCYTSQRNHTHSSSCYTTTTLHTHDSSCYTTKTVHTHSSSCYTTKTVHTHDSSCYKETMWTSGSTSCSANGGKGHSVTGGSSKECASVCRLCGTCLGGYTQTLTCTKATTSTTLTCTKATTSTTLTCTRQTTSTSLTCSIPEYVSVLVCGL